MSTFFMEKLWFQHISVVHINFSFGTNSQVPVLRTLTTNHGSRWRARKQHLSADPELFQCSCSQRCSMIVAHVMCAAKAPVTLNGLQSRRKDNDIPRAVKLPPTLTGCGVVCVCSVQCVCPVCVCACVRVHVCVWCDTLQCRKSSRERTVNQDSST